jgi:hypothetical protein
MAHGLTSPFCDCFVVLHDVVLLVLGSGHRSRTCAGHPMPLGGLLSAHRPCPVQLVGVIPAD